MTKEQLRRIATAAGHAAITLYAPLLERHMTKYGICGRLRESAFIATIIHESGSFRYTREIASGAAYEGRKDLGNIYKGDGIKFKGRGLIQITGRTNYEKASKALGVDFVSNPQLLEQPRYATQVSCWWWADRGLNEIADRGDFRKVTRVVNGGYTGWSHRLKFYNRAKEVLG